MAAMTGNWIFDTRSQIFYKFPKLVLEPDTGRLTLRVPDQEFMLTMTHIIHSYVGFSISDPSEIIQAYVIPDDNETHELRLSHETTPRILGTAPRFLPVSFLLHNSVIDPVTESTRLKFLHISQSPHNQEFLCTDITLPANSTVGVLPMSISTHVVFDIAEADGMCISLLSSTDGFARGLCVMAIASAKARIRKFTVDGTGETCMGLVGDVLPLSPVATYRSTGSFDGTRGRLFLTMKRDGEAVVLDIE
ncbi:hypothetical protein OG21DRAFT_668918 [Imleria badia]|nr:hypothetical protein OG21DRAFT_668918 [Imleria badia]